MNEVGSTLASAMEATMNPHHAYMEAMYGRQMFNYKAAAVPGASASAFSSAGSGYYASDESIKHWKSACDAAWHPDAASHASKVRFPGFGARLSIAL